MKKFLIILIAFLGISYSANAQKLSCSIYGEQGATVTLLDKGDQATGDGTVYCSVKVDNCQINWQEGRYVRVWVEAINQNTGYVVKRANVDVWIRPKDSSGKGVVKFEGLHPYGDYIFSVDSAKTCE